jgi:hypothetical protein
MEARTIDRVPGFPACRLFALLDTDADLHGALSALAAHVGPGAVRVLSGGEGVWALDVSGGSRGVRGRLARVVQDLAYGRGTLETHERHLLAGGHLLVIRTREWEQCRRLVETLSGWGAHGLVWFARHSVVDVTPRYCAATGAPAAA